LVFVDDIQLDTHTR